MNTGTRAGSGDGQSRWNARPWLQVSVQWQGPDVDAHVVMGAKAGSKSRGQRQESWLSVCFPVPAVSWRWGEAASGTDGVPSPERVRGDGAQLQGSRLGSCTHGDTEA